MAVFPFSENFLGPNTKFKASMLREKVLLCGGEDRFELLNAMRAVYSQQIPEPFSFRSYEIWTFEDFALILCGIGTGCVEPLLGEILKAGVIRQIILFGTAGLPKSSVGLNLHTPYLVRNALPWLTAIDSQVSKPIPASWPQQNLLGECRSISTDLYYLSENLSDKVPVPTFPHNSNGILIEMEIAQFYFICNHYQNSTNLSYAAIKGAANMMGAASQQIQFGQTVIENALRAALQLLGISSPSTALVPASDLTPVPQDNSKLIEEVKLYWTVQLGALTALGVLANGFKDGAYVIPLAAIALGLVLGASAYNVLGSFFIWQSRHQMGVAREGSNLMLPLFIIIHTLLASIFGGLMGSTIFTTIHAWSNVPPPTTQPAPPSGFFIAMAFFAFAAAMINYVLIAKVFAGVCSINKHGKIFRANNGSLADFLDVWSSDNS